MNLKKNPDLHNSSTHTAATESHMYPVTLKTHTQAQIQDTLHLRRDDRIQNISELEEQLMMIKWACNRGYRVSPPVKPSECYTATAWLFLNSLNSVSFVPNGCFSIHFGSVRHWSELTALRQSALIK